MSRPVMSRAGTALLRALLARVKGAENRILLIAARSVDWQSLTFTGERHELTFRLLGPDSETILDRFTGGLAEAEFPDRGHIVADVAVWSSPERLADGSIRVGIEALTIAA